MCENKMHTLPESKEFIISGTIEEIISILSSDFGINEEEARFIIYIFTAEKQERVAFEERDLKLWYLNEAG